MVPNHPSIWVYWMPPGFPLHEFILGSIQRLPEPFQDFEPGVHIPAFDFLQMLFIHIRQPR